MDQTPDDLSLRCHHLWQEHWQTNKTLTGAAVDGSVVSPDGLSVGEEVVMVEEGIPLELSIVVGSNVAAGGEKSNSRWVHQLVHLAFHKLSHANAVSARCGPH